ncbi:GNAT family N-acetyltransferase [Vibrio parahaemolyticus]|uniref:GNAT family N-acetyltransferase n=1 Tax=Vibrio parahaemolyticus TaxID=670 RepID=UPI0004726B03|nr:GNAT family N-acetyltransferase [Vibrio parahaemolyticus]EGQ7784169.1 GNAT family N-acetyltransferase [Vibrio parahaemolyticus]EKH9213051.1 GNAT family N-acetyltransferase [Vibrio parahaemolyticus]MBY4652984.1 GNAT family N-acetyltransferase [Vibrio parahaemolyticus]MCR9889464.1 GNAT family N-acetyltransferase [Vibrio parahaemolyticus]MCR9919450.1 GNAT family N-acetyltransferase [Vibrio parahaemolyticus]
MKPDLHGSRIVLRSIQTNDSDDLFEIYGDIQTMEFASDPVFTSEDMVVQMLESVVRLEKSGESLEWAVMEQATSKVIGTCGLHSFSDSGDSCEVGCLLNSSYWRQGYMSEALSLLFSHAKSLGIEKLYADIDEGNFRSQALFNKLGCKVKNGQFQRLL